MKPNNLSLQVHFSSHEGAPAAIYAEELVVKMQELLRRTAEAQPWRRVL